MSMTRKDFEAIAKIIKQYQIASGIMGLSSGDSIANVSSMANDLADYFKQANSSFDKERFMKACGFNGEP